MQKEKLTHNCDVKDEDVDRIGKDSTDKYVHYKKKNDDVGMIYKLFSLILFKFLNFIAYEVLKIIFLFL